MRSIKKGLIESLLLASKNVYPNEFFCLLGGKGGTIEEFVVVPAIFGDGFASYSADLIPFDREIIGTMHSHPSIYNHPSEADLESFRKFGKVHIIISYPYDLNTIRAFDNNGKTVQLKVIE